MRRTFIGLLTFALLGFFLASASYSASGSRVLATGEFEGQNDHEVIGTVSILEIGGAAIIVLGPDFELDGAPDPKVALGKDGYDKTTLLSLLESKKGAQTFELPKSTRVEDYNEVWIWCEKYNVALGVAKLRDAKGSGKR